MNTFFFDFNVNSIRYDLAQSNTLLLRSERNDTSVFLFDEKTVWIMHMIHMNIKVKMY